jgi:hypothetical protein
LITVTLSAAYLAMWTCVVAAETPAVKIAQTQQKTIEKKIIREKPCNFQPSWKNQFCIQQL